MNKTDFLNELKDALIGVAPPQVVNDNLMYYEEYIASELQKGRDEEEVLQGLGDPRLLARTIIDALSRDKSGSAQPYYGSGDSNQSATEESSSQKAYSKVYNGNSLSCLITFVIFLIVFFIISALLLKVIWFLAPVILALVVLRFLFKRR
ncbi:MAG: DUF1700 domain-containing protein [Lachnospiraceae bacterium]|nr:DUF1700 domain-containing protein [Lachnospiraceae bacterium]